MKELKSFGYLKKFQQNGQMKYVVNQVTGESKSVNDLMTEIKEQIINVTNFQNNLEINNDNNYVEDVKENILENLKELYGFVPEEVKNYLITI